MTDSSGTVVERYAYSPYGVTTILAPNGSTPRATSSVGNSYMYTGRRLDKEFATSSEDAIYYYRARYYLPTLGRFGSRDPLQYVDGMSVYGYVRSVPMQYVDPYGLRSVTIYINISAKGAPRSFNAVRVCAKLKKMLNNCLKCEADKVSLNCGIIPNRSGLPQSYNDRLHPDKRVSNDRLGEWDTGWQYDRAGFWENDGAWDWVPVVNIGVKTWRGFAKKPSSWTGYVQWGQPGLGMESTSGEITTIDGRKFENSRAGVSSDTGGGWDWDQMWANVLAHGQIHLGLMGESDDWDEDHYGWVESHKQWYNAPARMSDEWCKKLKDRLGVN
jgi:RHS repeat-associated protein